jgi:hypothetical protein
MSKIQDDFNNSNPNPNPNYPDYNSKNDPDYNKNYPNAKYPNEKNPNPNDPNPNYPNPANPPAVPSPAHTVDSLNVRLTTLEQLIHLRLPLSGEPIGGVDRTKTL